MWLARAVGSISRFQKAFRRITGGAQKTQSDAGAMGVMNVRKARIIFELLTTSRATICLACLSLLDPFRRNAILFKAVTAENVGVGSPVFFRFLCSQLLMDRLQLFLVPLPAILTRAAFIEQIARQSPLAIPTPKAGQIGFSANA